MHGPASRSTCPFCPLLAEGERHPATIARMPTGLAILNVDQRYRGRSLLIFERHLEDITELTPAEFAAFGEDMRRLSAAVARTSGAERMNHALLGNVVPHVHWHVIPRTPDDPNWGAPPWPVEARRLADEHAYRHLAGRIAAALAPGSPPFAGEPDASPAAPGVDQRHTTRRPRR